MKKQLLSNVYAIAGFVPEESSGTAITGDVIDRQGYDSLLAVVNVKASSGTPDTAVALIRIEDAEEQAFNVTNATYVTLAAAADVKSKTTLYYNVDLRGANRYVRIYIDITYTNGTTPKNFIAADLVFGEANVEPVTAAVSQG
jgi:hypothetical protein